MALYQIWNAARPTTSKVVAVTTGTGLKTLLQIQPSATIVAKVKEWGFKCDAPASLALASIELIETDVAATSLTAHVASGINKLDGAALAGGDPTTNLIQVGTGATGYTAGAEGTTTDSRLFDAILQSIPSSNGYEFVKQFPLGLEPIIQISKFLRVRVQFSVATNALCYVTIEV